MKTGALPQQVDIRSLASRQTLVEGTVTLADCPRLSEAGVLMEQPASARFQLGRDDEGRYTVTSSVKAKLGLVCQRCLAPMLQEIETGSVMACAWSDEEAAALPATYEPLIVGEVARLADIVEEELLLAIPVSPLHEDNCLNRDQADALIEPKDPVGGQVRDNPFAVLEQMKTP